MASTAVKTRGKTKNPEGNWSAKGMPKSVIRLAVDTSDPQQHRRAEQLFSATFQVRRAVQADARSRVDAYWAAPHERAEGPKAVRERLGLTRKGLEAAVQAHLDAAPHLLRWCSKALGQHIADSVWTAVDRHLFADNSGRLHGRPKVGGWWEYTRIPGRAKLHTVERKWETFRLHGTLDATRQTMTPVGWRYHTPVPTPATAPSDTAWWSYDGPLQVVLTGHGDATMVLPVRLPTAQAQQAHLDWYLARPERWHKLDLVRHSDPHAPGGWAYEAHLLCLTAPYVSDSTRQRRATAAQATADRRAGGDVNVSNITIASHRDGGDLQITTIQRTCFASDEKDREKARRVKERRRQRALDRSRRNANPDQYEPSGRQEKAAKRRADNGLPARAHTPHGPRTSRVDGTPRQAYRKDRLSRSYRRGRGVAANDARAAAIARRDTARTLAGDLVATHGTDLTIEAGSIAAWAKVWGKAVHAFTPGLLIAAIQSEVVAVSAGAVLRRAGTRQTAMSQHCLCQRRAKKPLSQRTHHCPDCGLAAGRDALSAVLASCVDFADPTDPTTATVDYHLTGRLLANEQTRQTLHQSYQGVQVRLCASTDTPTPTPDGVGKGTRPPATTAGSAPRTGQVPTTTPDETPADAGDQAGTRPTTNPNAPPDPQSGSRDIS
ncbi:hypothetical protein BH23ACT9_BH23ACT9_15410 [soil metagenome]